MVLRYSLSIIVSLSDLEYRNLCSLFRTSLLFSCLVGKRYRITYSDRNDVIVLFPVCEGYRTSYSDENFFIVLSSSLRRVQNTFHWILSMNVYFCDRFYSWVLFLFLLISLHFFNWFGFLYSKIFGSKRERERERKREREREREIEREKRGENAEKSRQNYLFLKFSWN